MERINLDYTKSDGQSLPASQWNTIIGGLQDKTNEIVTAINNGGGSGGGSGLPNFYINNKGNLNIETSPEIGNTSKGKINIESMSDIQLKPGDDIILYSHHRADDKQDEVAIKVTDGNDVPVKLQLNAAEMTISTKDKTGSNANVFDVNINSGKNTKGYLKVRAQAIDLRSETHGGIALQPKGYDSEDHMNKIKFEHGGGDGLEFGTFNTEKTSIFTDEYRFNKNGVWKMATRTKKVSPKADAGDPTTQYQYNKQADDFYDIIDNTDDTATTKSIIKTAHAFNGLPNVETHITSKGNLEIATKPALYTVTQLEAIPQEYTDTYHWDSEETMFAENTFYTAAQFIAFIDTDNESTPHAHADGNKPVVIVDSEDAPIAAYTVTEYKAPSINIESANDIKIDAANKLELKGILDFGDSFSFGEVVDGVEAQYKLTKKGTTKDCTTLKIVGINNHATDNLVVDGTTIAPGLSTVLASCSLLDVVKLVNYMKTNNPSYFGGA